MKGFKKVFDYLDSIKGCRFIAIKNYKSEKSGEISNVVFNIGASYENAVKKDIATLEAMDVTTLKSDFDTDVLVKAKEGVLASLKKPSKTHSDAQNDAYIYIGKGMKLNKNTGEIYLSGFQESKKVIVKGEYKTVNSRELTLAKKFLEKSLRKSKFRYYKVPNIEEIKAGNDLFTIEN